jgi:hypothetical protein
MSDVGEGYLVLADSPARPRAVIQCHHGGSVTDHTIINWQAA